ncbi:MAG: phospholipid scramblase family protein [Actinomycetota bacterium]|nr:phospholipid scramblase family protein [Actinomycetota bacterium]
MPLIDQPRFFVNQKAKLIELTNEYRILDEAGAEIGVIRQEGQSKLKKMARLVSRLDQFMTHTLAVYEPDGTKVVQLTRPRKLLKSRLQVTDGGGVPVGTIAQENVVGKKRFALTGNAGEVLGAINAENWRSWDFRIEDAQGGEVGRITKKWAGAGRELFTTADNYMVEVSEQVTGPLRLLALAAAAGVDTALKQDSG